MARVDRLKEEIGWLKLVFGALIAIDATLLGWLAQHYAAAGSLLAFAGGVAALAVSLAVAFINQLAYARIRELEDALMEWVVIVALVALVGALLVVVRDAHRLGGGPGRPHK